MLSKGFQTTLHKKIPVQCYLNTLGTTLYMKNTLCNVVQEAPDNIAHEKILFSVVVKLLGQHCTGKNPVQCYPKRLQTTLHRKNPVHCRLNNITFRRFLFRTLHKKHPGPTAACFAEKIVKWSNSKWNFQGVVLSGIIIISLFIL